jgi:hypothetical protein
MRQLELAHLSGLSAQDRERLVVITPNLGAVDTLDFGLGPDKKRELFQAGRIAVSQVLPAAAQAGPQPPAVSP